MTYTRGLRVIWIVVVPIPANGLAPLCVKSFAGSLGPNINGTGTWKVDLQSCLHNSMPYLTNLAQDKMVASSQAIFPDVFLAATKQLYKWYFPSVCLSVRPSVTPFSPCSHHRIIMKFSGVITNDKSDVHAKGQGQRSKVKVTEVNTQLNRFRTVTLVWIHIWWWNDANSLIMLRRGALLFLKVIRQISRSHGSKKRIIWPRWAFPDSNSSLNSPMAMKWCKKLEVA